MKKPLKKQILKKKHLKKNTLSITLLYTLDDASKHY